MSHYDGRAMNDAQRPKVGETILVTYGPFLASATVIDVGDHGARIDVNDDAKLIGHDRVTAPNGDVLTDKPTHDWIGSAHWHSIRRP